ncbi:MAG: PIG-L family deacetylase [Planctomycetota bacterium]|nr:PIG-L family deacetylase [Planctomycetota bacterium]
MNRTILRGVWLLLAVLALPLRAAEQNEPPFERGADLLRLEAMSARTKLVALSVAAHPDDEDGATISWLRRFGGVEVHMCLSTRGEGGQNEAGPELGAALAWKRTQETEAAARILGAKVWYLNLPDFGFSKTAEETFKVWPHEEALGRLVRIIRIVRPDILFTNHNPEGKDHGHHVATARLLFEAFEAAADPKRFPEQIEKEGLKPWQASKLYRRLWDFEREQSTVRLDVSKRDPVAGASPAEIASWALEKHASQGMHRETKPGERVERFFLLAKQHATERYEPAAKDAEKETDLLSGFKDVPDAESRMRIPLEMELSAPMLLGLDPDNRHTPRLRQALHGLSVTCAVRDPLIALGESTEVVVRVANAGEVPVTLQSLAFSHEPGWEAGALEVPKDPIAPRSFVELKATLKATAQAAPTYPPESHLDERIETRSPVAVSGTVSVNKDVKFELAPVQVPVQLAPLYEARFVHDPYLVFDDPDHDEPGAISCRAKLLVTNHRREPWTLYVKPQENPRFMAQPTGKYAGAKLDFTEPGQTLTAELPFTVTVAELSKMDLPVTALLFQQGDAHSRPVTTRFRRVPLKLPGPLNVGIVRTYDSATCDALKLLAGQSPGMSLLELTPEDLEENDLAPLHTIVLDLRAAQYRPDVVLQRERLKAFMENGGNIVCLYHKDFDWNEPGEDARGRGFFRGKGGGGVLAPFPITLSFARVTDEEAAVKLLQPAHPLLSRPCKIWDEDFAGWVQERGVYFPSKWDERYTPLLSSSDPGNPALDGGLLVADLGKGKKGSFIYTSYVWYRQLRAGVPGAYRMLANLIAYPVVKNEGKK